MNRYHISTTLHPQMTLFEIVDAHPTLLSILSRLGISLPFGDITIEETCRREGRNVELFITLCAMHCDIEYRPDTTRLTQDMLPEVVNYLRASHRYYAGYMLPHAAAHLEEILSHCDTLSQRALRKFYDDYVTNLEEHFTHEEREIFATIERATADTAADLDALEHLHTDIDDRTNDIASLVFKSLPEEAPTQLRTELLGDIYMLRDDLRRHSNIEMYLLRPLVNQYLK